MFLSDQIWLRVESWVMWLCLSGRDVEALGVRVGPKAAELRPHRARRDAEYWGQRTEGTCSVWRLTCWLTCKTPETTVCVCFISQKPSVCRISSSPDARYVAVQCERWEQCRHLVDKLQNWRRHRGLFLSWLLKRHTKPKKSVFQQTPGCNWRFLNFAPWLVFF